MTFSGDSLTKVPSALVGMLLICVLMAACAGSARAEECPNQVVRAQEPYAGQLPECRAYEQVSPVEKNATDADVAAGYVETSPAGNALTFFSGSPFPDAPASIEFPSYLSTDGPDGWSTQGLLPLADPGSFEGINGLTGDLSKTLLYAKNPAPVPGGTPGRLNAYLRDNATGTYQLFARGPSETYLATSTPDDSHILFEDTYAGELVPGVVDEFEVPYLYEWSEGHVSFIGEVEGHAPSEGTVAGADLTGYDQNTISNDGSRVFFTDLENGHVYMRDLDRGETLPVSEGRAEWQGATPDGSTTFYIEAGRLFRYDTITQTREALTSSEAGVAGTLGITENASIVYFAATAALTPGASTVAGRYNLYEWHGGAIAFIASVDGSNGRPDWINGLLETAEGIEPYGYGKTSRVTPSGSAALFWSGDQLYLFDAESGALDCVSCDPTTGAPLTEAYLATGNSAAAPGPIPTPYLTRNLSADGNRVFFETAAALVPQDTNTVLDVYEWQRAGTGECPLSDEHGCLRLISTGQSDRPSYFGDASADGSDVFIFTAQSLVAQDKDSNYDVYDARVDGGLPGQNPAPSASPCVGEACRGGALATVPASVAPASATFSGPGDLVPLPPTVTSRQKPLTEAQKLTAALKVCRAMRKQRRAGCERKARKRYPVKSKARALKPSHHSVAVNKGSN